MPLELPKIDDRNYQQILNETLSRIPVHNPEWTNFNDSDPGITLVQLFAFMTENLLYRANLIPERNRIKFLRLLGIPMQPPEAAMGFVTFSNTRGPLETITVNAGLEVYSGQVPFRTLNGLDVLPVEAQVYYKGVPSLTQTERQDAENFYRTLYASLDKSGVTLTLYDTKRLMDPVSGAVRPVLNLAEDTVDRCLWIALLARKPDPNVIEATRKAIANKVLTLGVMPSLREEARVLKPEGVLDEAAQSTLIFEIPKPKGFESTPDEIKMSYKQLPEKTTTNLLLNPGVVELTLPEKEKLEYWKDLDPTERGVGNLPPALEDPEIENRIITWIRVRRRTEEETDNQLSAQISWMGINAVMVSQRLHVFAENLGQGNGEPDQTVTLINTPVIPDSVNLMVNGETWQEIDDLAAADPEVPRRATSLDTAVSTPSVEQAEPKVNVYTLDRESGEIRFGDGLRGKRPPAGSIIQATYDYGGGTQGQVGIGAINKAPRLPAGLKITNPLPTWGGNQAETVEEAEKRIPSFLHHRDRLVSHQDFEEIAKETPGVDIGRVEVLPLYHPEIGDVPSPGVVTLMVIPRFDIAQPDAPLPDRLFLREVCEYLYPRRLVTTELHVRGPSYVPIWVTIGIEVIAGKDFAPLREKVKQEIRTFLSPLKGGYEKDGWLLSRDVDAEELKAVATRVEGVAKVNGLQLGGSTGSPQPRVSILGLELPRLMDVSVQLGDPMNLEDLREGIYDIPAPGPGIPPPGSEIPIPGEGPEGEPLTPTTTPIPIVPPECKLE